MITPPDERLTAQPFLWTAAGAQGMLHEPIGGENVAGPINNVRQVVGWAESDVPKGWDSMTFLWSPATGLVPIWATNGEDGGFQPAASDINDQATMVGMIEAGNVTPFSGGRVAVVAQMRTTSTIRERHARSDPRGSAARCARARPREGLAREARSDRSRAPHPAQRRGARELQQHIVGLNRKGALADAYALPLRILSAKLIDRSPGRRD